MSNDGITWDDDQTIHWDEPTLDKARDIVHGGQSSYFPNMATAAGKALVELARKSANLLNLGGSAGPTSPGEVDTHEPTAFGSPENIRQAEQETQEAAAKPGGRFGQIVADTAGTAPIGGPIEAGVGKLLGPLGNSLLARIASQPLKSAASGAALGGITSDPGERLSNAETGSALGGSLGFLQKILGRGTSGIVKKSSDLQLLESDVARSNALPGAAQRNLFVPVSQGADPNDVLSSSIGRLYRGGLPYIPGVAPQLLSQGEKAGQTLRGAMLQLSSPEGHVVPAQATEDMQLSTKQVADEYKAIYNKLRQVNNISIPKNFNDDLKAKIQVADPQIPESAVDAHVGAVRAMLDTQAENSKDGMINGWNLKNTRDNVQGMNADTPMAQREGLINTTKDYLDQMFGNKLKQAFNLNQPSTQDILNAYKVNAPNYENFRPLKDAVEGASATSGKFPFGSVARKANEFTDIEGIDQSAKSVLGQSAVQPSAAARVAGYPVVLGATGYLGHLPGVAAILGGGNALATKFAQRGLYGDTALQSALKELATRNPKLAASLGYAARSAITSDIGEDDVGSQ